MSRKRIRIWGELGIGVDMAKTHCRNSKQTNTKKKVKRKLTRYVLNFLPRDLQIEEDRKAGVWGAHTAP